MNNHQKKLYQKGLCIDCGINHPDVSKYRCAICLQMSKDKARLKYGGVDKQSLKGKK